MAKSIEDICNRALGAIGVTEYIQSIEDDSVEAQTCDLYYDAARESCLADFPWPFATLRSTLAVNAIEPVRDGYLYVYGIPTDCLKPRAIWPAGISSSLFNAYPFLYGANLPIAINPRTPNSSQRVPFAIEKSSVDDSQVLLCDLQRVVLFYTSQVNDPTKFPPEFAAALSYRVATDLVMPLTKKADRAKLVEVKYAQLIREAWANALNSMHEDQPPDSEAIIGRL